jgi:hypothetical protein
MKRLFTGVLLAVCLGTVEVSVRAADQPKNKSSEAAKAEKKKQVPFRGKVSAVDKVAKTVALEGKEKQRVFQITSATKITKDGKPAVLDNINAGDSVGGLARENAAGKLEIITLNVGAKAGKAKPDGEKEKK